MHISGIGQPSSSIPPGHIISSGPQNVGQNDGQLSCLAQIPGTQRSGNGQPDWGSMPPGHIISSGPHFAGSNSGQAEAAAAKRVKVMKTFIVNARIQLRCCTDDLSQLLYRK